jgi:electron transport complex protein RnfC
MLKGRGDEVAVGERIAEASGKISAHVHSPVAGKIKKVTQKPLPGGKMADYVQIQVDTETTDAHQWQRQEVDLESLTRESVVETVKEAGIVGMGGATFPTHVKLSPPPTSPIDTLILNGSECEPYLTCDHRVMVEHAEEIIRAAEILHRAFGFEAIYIGIEENKPDAIAAMEKQVALFPHLPLRVVGLHTKYPQGAEKMLINATTGREVPVGKLPMDVGAVVSNIQTMYAIYEAFYYGKPLIERVMTVSGEATAEPKNLRVPVGATLEQVIEPCGGLPEGLRKAVMGGPMMGIALPTLDYSVGKGTSGLLLFRNVEVPEEGPCIRCGRCVDVCPMNLMPLKLAAFAKNGKFAEAKALDLAACIECGSCAFGCPAKINIVAWVRYAKNYVRVHGI